MLKRTVRKMRSEHGASLSMALLLFLVCTIVASIAITAGTAASGRLSQLRESTKSYYNVTSVAKILAEELESSGVINITTSCNATRNAESWIPTENTCSMVFNGKTVLQNGTPDASISRSNATLFELLTCDLLFYDNTTDLVDTDLTNDREITEERVFRAINFSSSNPNFIIDFKNVPYKSFDVELSKNPAKSLFNTVHVTVTCDEDDKTYSFSFTEDSSLANPLPSVYTVVGSLQTSTSFTPSDTQLEWNTTVTWGYLYTIAGG